jgi:tRNA(Ile)-lysidine synthase
MVNGERALQLGQLLPREALHSAARRAADLSAARLEPWAVGVSGGADSLALLALLLAHWPGQGPRLRVLHFNHALRGAESDADADAVRAQAAALGLAFAGERWETRPPRSGEDEARRARWDFFARALHDAPAAALFLGHNLEDLAETQLMRLARGASAAGLAAPRPVRPWQDRHQVLRPLLTVSRERLREALAQVGISWREDASNATDHHLRNRIRHHVLPAWQSAAGPAALEGAALTRDLLEEDDACLAWCVAQLGIDLSGETIDVRPLQGKPTALWRRVLRQWPPLGSLARAGFDQVLAAAQAGVGRVSAGNRVVEARPGTLQLLAPDVTPSPWGPVLLVTPGSIELPGGARLSAASHPEAARAFLQARALNEIDPRAEAWLAVEPGPFHVRGWQPGDRYRPLGAPGSAKLQDLFINRKIPPGERHLLPVVCAADGRILWVPGLPPAEDSKLTDDSVTAVQLTYSTGTITVRNQS